MAVGSTPRDSGNIPLGCAGAVGDPTPQQIRGGKEYTDSQSNITTNIAVTPEDGWKATYSFAKLGLVPAASPTDIFTITGSATKIVRVTHIEMNGISSAAVNTPIDVLLLRRSTADTGGTSTGSPTAVQHDTNDAAVTATVLAYTANPTTGTLVGTAIRNLKLWLGLSPPTVTDFPEGNTIVWDFGNRPGEGIVLRGIAQVLAINLNGVTTPAGCSLNISVELTEE